MATKFITYVSGIPRLRDSLPAIYDQTYTVPSLITTGTAVTLPSSGTYSSSELLVFLNGQALEVVTDYNYVGSGTRTQVSFTFDLIQTDKVRFVKERDV